MKNCPKFRWYLSFRIPCYLWQKCKKLCIWFSHKKIQHKRKSWFTTNLNSITVKKEYDLSANFFHPYNLWFHLLINPQLADWLLSNARKFQPIRAFQIYKPIENKVSRKAVGQKYLNEPIMGCCVFTLIVIG